MFGSKKQDYVDKITIIYFVWVNEVKYEIFSNVVKKKDNSSVLHDKVCFIPLFN